MLTRDQIKAAMNAQREGDKTRYVASNEVAGAIGNVLLGVASDAIAIEAARDMLVDQVCHAHDTGWIAGERYATELNRENV